MPVGPPVFSSLLSEVQEAVKPKLANTYPLEQVFHVILGGGKKRTNERKKERGNNISIGDFIGRENRRPSENGGFSAASLTPSTSAPLT